MLGRLPAVSPTFLALLCGILTGIYAFKPLFTPSFTQLKNNNSEVDLCENETGDKMHNNVK